jgi:hypothetical protein
MPVLFKLHGDSFDFSLRAKQSVLLPMNILLLLLQQKLLVLVGLTKPVQIQLHLLHLLVSHFDCMCLLVDLHVDGIVVRHLEITLMSVVASMVNENL